MNWLLLSPQAMGFLPVLIWHSIILGYLLRLQRKTPQTWLLIAWFTGLTLLMATQCLGYALYAPAGGYLNWIGGILSALGAVSLEIQLAYVFPRPLYPRERRWVRGLSLIIVLGMATLILWEVTRLPAQSYYNFGQSVYGPKRADTGHMFPSAWLFNPIHITGHVWALGVWLRKLFYLETGAYRPRDFVRCLLHPQKKDARAARDFALLIAAAALAAVVQILEAEGHLPAGLFAACYALVLFGIMLTYLSSAPESSSFMVKLVSISLVALLILLGLINPRILQTQQAAYAQARQSDLAHLAPALADAAGGAPLHHIPPAVQYIAARPAAEGLLADTYTLLFARPEAPAATTLAAQDRRRALGLARQRRDVQLIVSDEFPWLTLEQVAAGEARWPVQPETPAYRGSDAPQAAQYARYLLLSADGMTVYEIGYSYLAYRQMIHRAAGPLVLLLGGATALILFVFPRFFQASLVKPLATLLDGVARVNQGDLNVAVPVQQQDEIGFLARSFNAMVASRRQAEAEIRESEARFRALFEHAPLCIFEVDMAQPAPLITRANQQAEQVYGWPLARLNGAALDLIMPPQAVADMARMGAALRLGRTMTLESWSRRRDETVFPVRVSATPENAPGFSQVILIVEDITAEKERRTEEEAIVEERRRIAHEIHDGLAQVLASLRLRAEVWHTLVGRDPGRLHVELNRLQEILGESIRDVRRSIFALRPVALEELGFFPALRQFATDFSEQNQLYIDLRIVGTPERLPAPLEPVLFRLVQEALNNVSKHAQADTVWIELNLEATTHLTLQVRDDGVGFDLATLEQAFGAGHLGLKQMHERVANLQGTFSVGSQPGAGTHIHVTLPLAKS